LDILAGGSDFLSLNRFNAFFAKQLKEDSIIQVKLLWPAEHLTEAIFVNRQDCSAIYNTACPKADRWLPILKSFYRSYSAINR